MTISPVSEGRSDKPIQTFCKAERLCSTSLISALFDSGKSFHTPLFRIVWMDSPVKLPFPAQVAFSVSKRGFRHAVSRNLARRRMREAYRRHKYLLYEHLIRSGREIIITIILKGDTIPDYKTTEKAMLNVFARLISLT